MGIFNRNKEVLELDLSKKSLTQLSSKILKYTNLHESMSEDEFSLAIEKFNTMFIKKENLEEHCNIQTVGVY